MFTLIKYMFKNIMFSTLYFYTAQRNRGGKFTRRSNIGEPGDRGDEHTTKTSTYSNVNRVLTYSYFIPLKITTSRRQEIGWKSQ